MHFGFGHDLVIRSGQSIRYAGTAGLRPMSVIDAIIAPARQEHSVLIDFLSTGPALLKGDTASEGRCSRCFRVEAKGG